MATSQPGAFRPGAAQPGSTGFPPAPPGGPYKWAVTGGALPGGLTLSEWGVLSGTPAAGTYVFTATASDAAGVTASVVLTLTVTGGQLVLLTSALAPAVTGRSYSVVLAAAGGVPAPGGGYSWAVTGGALPPGLSLSGAVIGGVPLASAAGTWDVQITATDHLGATAAAAFTIRVVALGAVPGKRPLWHFIVADPMPGGGLQAELAPATALQLTVYSDPTQTDQATVTMDGRWPQTAAVAELASDIVVLRDGARVPLFRGRAGAVQDNLDADYHQLSVVASDYRAWLRRERLQTADTLAFKDTDQGAIAWSMVSDVQAHTGAYMGITQGVGGATGVARTITWNNQQFAGANIDTLAQLDSGFDWHVSPDSPGGLRLNIWSPFRGADKGVVIEYGGALWASGSTRQVDPSAYLNAALVTGDTTSQPAWKFSAPNGASPCPFTGTDSGFPGFDNDTPVKLSGSGGGFTDGVIYWVVGASGDTFKLAATQGGAALASTGTGTATGTVAATTVAIAAQAPGLATARQGRWDQVIGTTITDQNFLASHAAWYVAQGQVIPPAYTVVMPPGTWDGPEHIWAGDTVRLRIKSGRLAVDDSLRVLAMDFAIPPEQQAGEKVTLTIGALPLDLYKKIPAMLRSIRSLEAR